MKKVKTDFIFPILLFFLFFYLYLNTLSKNFNFDGVVYALFLRNSLVLKNPLSFLHYQHLLYQPLSYFLYLVSFMKLDPLFFLQLESMIFSLIAIILVYKTIVNITNEKLYSFVSTVSLGLTHIFWYYSTEAEVHSLSFLLISISLYIILKNKGKNSSGKALISGLPVLSHILNSFFTLGYIITTFVKKEKNRLKQIFLSVLIPAFSYLLLLFYLIISNKIESLISKNSIRSLRFDSLYAIISDFKSFGDFFYLGKFSIVFTLFFWLFFLYIILKKNKERIEIIFVSWVIIAFLFHLFWEPFNPELKSPLVILFFIILSKEIFRIKRMELPIMVLFAIILFSLNISFFKRNSDITKNKDFIIAERIKNITEPNSIIIIGGTSKGYIMGKAYIPYFSLRKVLSLSSYGGKIEKTDVDKILKRIALMGENSNIYILSDCLDYSKIASVFSDKQSFLYFKGEIGKITHKTYTMTNFKLYGLSINN